MMGKDRDSLPAPDGIPFENVMQGRYYDADRERVRMLRLGGAVTEQIAAETGLTEDKVRNYLRELALPEFGCCFSGDGAAALEHWYRSGCEGEPTALLCEHCGKPILNPARGRHRKFCSDKCRNAFWNENAREEKVRKENTRKESKDD